MVVNWNVTRVRICITGRSCAFGGMVRMWTRTMTDYDMLYICGGSGEIRSDEASIPLHAGVCIWTRPGPTYDLLQNPDDPIHHYYVHFELIDAAGMIRPYGLPLPPERAELGDSSMTEMILRRVTELLPYFDRRQIDRFVPEHVEISESLLRALLMEMDHAASSQHRAESGTRLHHNQLVMRAVARIQQCPTADLAITELADDAGYSVTHFSRVFRSVMGQSPEEYLIRQRIDRAKQLLRGSSLNVQEIAEELGYQQSNFFSTQFRQRTGLSPRDFRRLGSAGDSETGHPSA